MLYADWGAAIQSTLETGEVPQDLVPLVDLGTQMVNSMVTSYKSSMNWSHCLDRIAIWQEAMECREIGASAIAFKKLANHLRSDISSTAEQRFKEYEKTKSLKAKLLNVAHPTVNLSKWLPWWQPTLEEFYPSAEDANQQRVYDRFQNLWGPILILILEHQLSADVELIVNGVMQEQDLSPAQRDVQILGALQALAHHGIHAGACKPR